MRITLPWNGSAWPLSVFLALAAVLTAAPVLAVDGSAPPASPISGASGAPAEGKTIFPQETASAVLNGFTGKPVPAFITSTMDGRTLSASHHGGKALIIELWGLNCASCLEEMVELKTVYEEFRDRGLRIWSVNAEGISSEKILAGLEKKGISVPYDLIVDQDCSITHLFTRWFIPVTVIVDREGIVKYYKVGFNKKDIEKIREKVGELVAN